MTNLISRVIVSVLRNGASERRCPALILYALNILHHSHQDFSLRRHTGSTSTKAAVPLNVENCRHEFAKCRDLAKQKRGKGAIQNIYSYEA